MTREVETDVAANRSLASGRLSDLKNIMRLAVNSLGRGKLALAIDYCRTVINSARDSDQRDLVVEAFYVWCTASLQLGKPGEARKVCYEARLRLGNYLDLVYFELLIAAVNNDIDKIPRFANNFLDLHDNSRKDLGPAAERSREKIGEVLLMGGQAREQSNDIAGAMEFYNRYVEMFPEDKIVAELINQLPNLTIAG